MEVVSRIVDLKLILTGRLPLNSIVINKKAEVSIDIEMKDEIFRNAYYGATLEGNFEKMN